MVIVLILVHVELLLGLGMALLFADGVLLRSLMLAAVLAPYAVSEVSAVVMWRFLFDPGVKARRRPSPPRPAGPASPSCSCAR